MRNDFQRKDEISQLIKEYRTTQNELINIKNKNSEKIGTIGLFLLLIAMYIGFYFFGKIQMEKNYTFCTETDALENTMIVE